MSVYTDALLTALPVRDSISFVCTYHCSGMLCTVQVHFMYELLRSVTRSWLCSNFLIKHCCWQHRGSVGVILHSKRRCHMWLLSQLISRERIVILLLETLLILSILRQPHCYPPSLPPPPDTGYVSISQSGWSVLLRHHLVCSFCAGSNVQLCTEVEVYSRGYSVSVRDCVQWNGI